MDFDPQEMTTPIAMASRHGLALVTDTMANSGLNPKVLMAILGELTFNAAATAQGFPAEQGGTVVVRRAEGAGAQIVIEITPNKPAWVDGFDTPPQEDSDKGGE